MAFVASGVTIQGTAYLTGAGRRYLFNKNNVRFDLSGNDLFEITHFALGDPDQNYRASVNLSVGRVPDISGKSEDCLKSAVDYAQTSMLYFSNFDSSANSDVSYSALGAFVSNNTLSVNINSGSGSLPTGPDGQPPSNNPASQASESTNTNNVIR